jgi:hypothetical protein
MGSKCSKQRKGCGRYAREWDQIADQETQPNSYVSIEFFDSECAVCGDQEALDAQIPCDSLMDEVVLVLNIVPEYFVVLMDRQPVLNRRRQLTL